MSLIYTLLMVQIGRIISVIVADTGYVETRLGCYDSTQTTCPTNMQCEKNCISCVDNINQCLVCAKSYFLFTLPQKHEALGLEAGARVCVKCPYQTYIDEYTVYCGDCIENSSTWDKTRLCTYDYLIKNLDKTSGTFHQIVKPSKILFYIVPIALVSVTDKQYFQSSICDGCKNFCNAPSQVCFPVAVDYKYDLNNLYVSCADGYVFSEVINGCDSCPSNCKSCNIFLNRAFDSQGRTTYNVVKECLICNVGFSLYKGYPKVVSGTLDPKATVSIWCEACFTGCDECYFGNAEINLNSVPWDTYMAPTPMLWADQMNYILTKGQIAQRCLKCTSPPRQPYVPYLDMRSCLRCEGSCSVCEYTRYDGVTDPKLQYPTRNKVVIEPVKGVADYNPDQAAKDAVWTIYKFRCRFCDDPAYMLLATGNDCAKCTIANCRICHKINDPNQGGAAFSSFTTDFAPLDRESLSIESCLMCNDGFKLVVASGISTCTAMAAAAGCSSYDKDSKCMICEQGYTLTRTSADVRTCVLNCKKESKDPFCSSCYTEQIGSNWNLRCQNCDEGYYVNMQTGKCVICSDNDACSQCTQYSNKSIYRNIYFDYKWDLDTTPLGPICQTCKNPLTQTLNTYTMKCESCGDNCDSTKCVTMAQIGYCGQCKAVVGGTTPFSRSVNSIGSDCVACPENSVGCRDRTAGELLISNKFFSPDSVVSQAYSRISFECGTTAGVYYDTSLGRCMLCSGVGNKYCNKKITVQVKAYCTSLGGTDDVNVPDFFKVKTEKYGTITMTKVDHSVNWAAWNAAGVTSITIQLIFQDSAFSLQNNCLFPKDTILTTNIKKNVFSVQELSLEIFTKTPGTKIRWFVSGDLNIQYFTSVSIKDIEIMPAIDYNYLLPPGDPTLQAQAFTLRLSQNEGAKLILTDVVIKNHKAMEYYLGNDKSLGTYTTPYSAQAQLYKKYTPYNTYLLNVYDLQVTNVKFYSLNYLLAADLTFQADPFNLVYDSPIPYLNVKFDNVQFYDVAFENYAIIELQATTMLSTPEWNTKFYLKSVSFKDAYFINKAALLSTEVTDTPHGILVIDTFNMEKTTFNNSRGIINFQTMQSIRMSSITIKECSVNATSLFYVNTLEINDMLVSKSNFTKFGRLIETQYQSLFVKPNNVEYSGLRMMFTKLTFDSLRCLTENCIMYIASPKNAYFIPMNLTINQINVVNIISDGFDVSLVEAATSGAILIRKIYEVRVDDYSSLSNANLTIMYTEESSVHIFSSITCSQPKGLTIRNNYCLFINNYYRSVNITDVNIQYLNGRDNSFIAMSSWSNLVFNTTILGIPESIIINDVQVDQCTITTTALAVPSSAIVIESSQQQTMIINNLKFTNNAHKQTIKGTLRPSNPTIVIRSVIGNLTLKNSIWKNNYVNGYGAVLYLEAGTMLVQGINMVNSNLEPLHMNPTDPLYVPINAQAEGGHMYLQGYNITLLDSKFTNSTAKVGGGIYIKTLKEGVGFINNTIIWKAYTPLDGSAVTRGGCIYIDSSVSELALKFQYLDLKDCSVRADGGAIYLKSSDKVQNFNIINSIIENCYGLAGSAIKIDYEARTTQQQRTTLQGLKVQGNYTNSLAYFASLKQLTVIEEFLFIKRFAAIQQDYGQIVMDSCLSEGMYFYSYLSLLTPNYILLNIIDSQHSILSYRPNIEIIEPIQSPIVIQAVSFRNISSLNTQVNCIGTELTIEQKAICLIMQIRLDFPEYHINPALLVIDMITKLTPLKIVNLIINRVICKECDLGLVQILRVSSIELRELVFIGQSRCSNSETGYYGCLAITADDNMQILPEQDYDKEINYTYSTNLSSPNIKLNSGLARRQIGNDLQYLLQQAATDVNTEVIDWISLADYAIPNPPWLAHIVLMGFNVQEVIAHHGGAFSVYGLTANVTDMYCSLAIVTGEGGCIYYESTPKKAQHVNQRLNLLNSIFYKNNASIGGAIRVKESGTSDPTLSKLTLLQNFATLFGNNIAGYPTKMGMALSGIVQLQSYLNINTGWLHYPIVIRSGQKMSAFENQDLIFILLDEDNKQMKYQYRSKANMTSNHENTIAGEPSREFNLYGQGFNYSNLQIYFSPYQNITLDVNITSPIINIPKYHNVFPYQLIGFDTNYTLQARIRSVECERGESFNSQDGSCIPCGNGTYVLEFKGLCKEMDQEVMNASILNRISIKYAHWRPSHLSDIVEYCKNKPENCVGGFDSGNDLCTEGKIGALCEECDIYGTFWGQSYSMAAKYECGLCADNTTNIIMIIALSIWTVISTILSVKGNQERMELSILVTIIANFGWSSSQKAGANVAVMMKILTNHFQILSILQGFQISVPTKAIESVNTVAMPAKTVGNSLDCFLVTSTYGIELVYFRLIWSLVMQLIYIMAILFLMAVAVMIGKLQFKIQYVYTMAIFLFLLLQPDYVMQFMLLISSRVISGIPWIQANVSYRYDTYTHDQWIAAFGVPGLVTWVVVLPCTFMYVVFQGAQQDKLDSFFFGQSWGFLYYEYRRTRYYWEFIKIFTKTVLSILIVYFQEDIVVKGILSFFVVYIYYGLSSHFLPFQSRTLNDIDAFSTVTLSLSLVIGVFLYRTIEIDFTALTFIGYIVIAVLNGIFILIMVYQLSQGYLAQFAPKLDEIRDKVVEKFPQLLLNQRLKPYLINRTKINAKARKLWIMVSKIVSIGLQDWKLDKTKPLTFARMQESFISDQNQRFNEALRQLENNHDDNSSHISSIAMRSNGNGQVLQDVHSNQNEHHSMLFDSQLNDIAEEGKDGYSYK